MTASAVAAAALALYVATLQPDFGGPEDTPKFQFLGHVLGTAHPPGYPLYVMLSHLFVQLPIRTIAYRANLFSAVMATLAVVLVYVIGRSIGARARYSVTAALALAAGASYWRSAVFAEVYSLAAALAAGFVAVLLAWGARGGTRRLLGAVAVFALALGNHLTIVGVVPAAFIYVLLKDRRAVSFRVVAAAAGICLLGLAQYGFIIERTRDGASYLESRAGTVAELLGVIRADRFADQRFAFGAAEVFERNVPAVATLIAQELRLPGVLLLAAGAGFAIVRRTGGVGLLLGCAAGMLAMIVNMSGDLKGFITPVVVLLWPLTALGAEGIHRVLAATRLPRLVAPVVAVAAALLLPAATLGANYREADQSSQTATATFLRQVYAGIPPGSGVVAEDYFYDMAHHYFTAPGEVAAGRDILRVGYSADEIRAAARSGRRIFAYAAGATVLAADGLSFERTPLEPASLSRWLADLPAGSIVAGAAALVAVPFDPALVGHSKARAIGRSRSFEAFALVVRKPGAAWRGDQESVSLRVDAATLKAPIALLPGLVEAHADASGASIAIDGRPVGSVQRGLTLVVFSPGGVLARSLEFPEGAPLNVPFGEALYELTGESACAEVTGDSWQDVTAAMRTGGAVAILPQLGSVGLELSFPAGTVAEASVLLGEADTSISDAGSIGPGDGASETRVWHLARTGSRRPLFRLALDRPPRTAKARLVPGEAVNSVRICGHRPSRQLFSPGADRARLLADFESEAFFGSGWGGAQRSPSGVSRRGRSGATLLLPLDSGFAYRLVMDLDSVGPGDWRILVNGAAAGGCRLQGIGRCEVVLPAALVQPGVTALTLVDATSDQSAGITFLGARLARERAGGG